MKREPLNQYVAVNMTPTERIALERMAYEAGATLSGTIRRLIRDAARATEQQAVGAAKDGGSHAG